MTVSMRFGSSLCTKKSLVKFSTGIYILYYSLLARKIYIKDKNHKPFENQNILIHFLFAKYRVFPPDLEKCVFRD